MGNSNSLLRSFFLGTSLLVILLFNGCSNDQTTPTGPTRSDYQVDSGTIGSAGGEIRLADEDGNITPAGIVIPGEALALDVMIQLENTSLPGPAFADTLSYCLATTPHGLDLAQPAVVTLPWPAESESASAMRAWSYDQESGTVQAMPILGINSAQRTITFATNHLSIFFATEGHLDFNVELFRWHGSLAATVSLTTGFDQVPLHWSHQLSGNVATLFDDPQTMVSRFSVQLRKKTASYWWQDDGLVSENRFFRATPGPGNSWVTSVDDDSEWVYLIIDSPENQEAQAAQFLAGEPVLFVFDEHSPIDPEAEYYVSLTWGMEEKSALYQVHDSREEAAGWFDLEEFPLDDNTNTVIDSWDLLGVELTGTVSIDQTPDGLDGPGWLLMGPHTQTGTGDLILDDLPTGQYSVVWSSLAGHITPPEATFDLVHEGAITFHGIYDTPADQTLGFEQIVPGTFLMGSNEAEDETPHTVTLTNSFAMAATEITNAQYANLLQWALNHGHCTATESTVVDALDGSTVELLDLDAPSCEISFDNGIVFVDEGKEDHPVRAVTWFGAAAYCDWFSLREDLPRAYDHGTWLCNSHAPYEAQGYRLPTEAEWEYACRAGTQTSFHTGECLDSITEANFNGTQAYPGCDPGVASPHTVAVASYPANAFGLYEMHGNIGEYCNDWYGPYSGEATNPTGPQNQDDLRVIRGGNWKGFSVTCRSANRYSASSNDPRDVWGFRIVLSVSN